MKLYRICSQAEIDAIKQNGFEKLTFGGCLFRYAGFSRCNSYKEFKNLWKQVCKSKGEQRLNPILKTFKGIPDDIPLYEKDILKRREICKRFVPNCSYDEEDRNSHYICSRVFDILHCENLNFDQVFLLSVKVAGFFDNISTLENCYCDLSTNDKIIMEVDLPKDVALKFKGKGVYGFGDIETEYAVPMYLLRPEHIEQTFAMTEEKIEQLKKEDVKKTERFVCSQIKKGDCKIITNDEIDFAKK